MCPPSRIDQVESSDRSRSDRRGELLSIAAHLFATKGFGETTVRDIAREAGILSGSLYHHFASKDEMCHEILRGFLEELHRRTMASVESIDSSTGLVDRLVLDAFQMIHDRPMAVTLYQNESSSLALQPGFEYLREAGKEVERIWRRAITQGQQNGEFRQDLDDRLLYRFIRDSLWSSAQWYRPGGSYTPERLAGQFLALLHGGLLT